MRYMGDPTTDFAAAMSQATKDSLLAYARTMPDDRAADLQDVCDATAYGGRTKWIRMGLGAAAGLAAGVVLGRALKRRR